MRTLQFSFGIPARILATWHLPNFTSRIAIYLKRLKGLQALGICPSSSLPYSYCGVAWLRWALESQLFDTVQDSAPPRASGQAAFFDNEDSAKA